MNLNLKKFLKYLKLNESNISMLLGALVVVIIGILVVNYFKDKKGSTLSTSLTTQNLSKEHIVTKGETLWSIAEDSFGSGYNWVDIKEANNLSSELIEVNQKLIIPDVAAKKPTSTNTSFDTDSAGTIQTDLYTVIKGDSLWKIAVRAYGDGFKWTKISKANNLKNPDLIYPGNVLTIPR